MLSKQHRLTRKEFNQVRKTGTKLFQNTYLAYYQKSTELKASVVISKKIAKKAILRNKLRRLIYSHLYYHYKNYNYYLILYPQAYEKNLSPLDQVLSKLS